MVSEIARLWSKSESEGEKDILGDLAFRYSVLGVILNSQDIASNLDGMVEVYEKLREKGEYYPQEYLDAWSDVETKFTELLNSMKELKRMQRKMIEEVKE